jgi:hypothetical protein
MTFLKQNESKSTQMELIEKKNSFFTLLYCKLKAFYYSQKETCKQFWQERKALGSNELNSRDNISTFKK